MKVLSRAPAGRSESSFFPASLLAETQAPAEAELHALLTRGFRARGAARRRLVAALRLATDFWAWRGQGNGAPQVSRDGAPRGPVRRSPPGGRRSASDEFRDFGRSLSPEAANDKEAPRCRSRP